VILVDDPDDPRLAPFRLNERGLSSRPQRRDDNGDGWFIAEGDLVVERALRAGCTPVTALVDSGRPPPVAHYLDTLIPVFAADESVRRLVTQNGVPNPLMAIFQRPPRPVVADLVARGTHLVVVEAVDNPANVGSIIRNAAGLGWHGLVLDRTSADPLARRALRVSMGHAVAFPHARTADMVATLRELAAAGYALVALTPAAHAHDIDRAPKFDRVALLIGSERTGLSDPVLAEATASVRIPMLAGIDSLNAAAATAIACHVFRPPTGS
jgi:tRNA G18 (ribose-2'-O)-methylase SpoU